MSSKKNVREKKLARQEAERKAKNRKFLTNGIALGMLFIGLAVGLTVQQAFGPQTCGDTDADMQAFLEESQGPGIELWKTAKTAVSKLCCMSGRIWAAVWQFLSGRCSACAGNMTAWIP